MKKKSLKHLSIMLFMPNVNIQDGKKPLITFGIAPFPSPSVSQQQQRQQQQQQRRGYVSRAGERSCTRRRDNGVNWKTRPREENRIRTPSEVALYSRKLRKRGGFFFFLFFFPPSSGLSSMRSKRVLRGNNVNTTPGVLDIHDPIIIFGAVALSRAPPLINISHLSRASRADKPFHQGLTEHS